jgi:diguanylate cyclase (GGDEF)-like protein/PAS domain S-box-containing protein
MNVVPHTSSAAPRDRAAQRSVASRPSPVSPRRRRPIRILFVSDSAAELEPYLRELEQVHFLTSAHVARNAHDFAERLRTQPYDIVISDETTRDWTGMRALQFLRERDIDMPFILVTGRGDDETLSEYILNGASDCVDRRRLNLLPLAVALAVEERAARDERNLVEQALQRSRALYEALVENPGYGVCQVDVDGRLVHANDALVAMLDYACREALVGANLKDVMRSLDGIDVLEVYRQAGRIQGLHVDLARTDGTLVRVRLSGRRVRGETKGLGDEWELIAEDITAQRALEQHLRHLAATDPLTGLANYRRLGEALDTEMKRAERTGRGFAVLMLDLDAMKSINDGYGHLTGDRALRRVAEALRVSCRSLDTVTRYGGDEFAVVMPETGPEGAAAIERRIGERLTHDSEAPRLSASVGVAVYPRDGETIEQLLLAADQALYRMKARHAACDRLSSA